MKNLIIILLTLVTLFSCNNSNEKKFKPDDDFGFDKKNEGEFIGEFSYSTSGCGVVLWFKNGKGDEVRVIDYITNDMSNQRLNKVGGDYNCSENLPRTSLHDSLIEFPTNFVGKLLKVKWSKFELDYTSEKQNSECDPSSSDPVILSVFYPLEKNIPEPSSNLTEDSDTKQESDTRLTIGELRGRVMGSTLNQVEDELGCININDDLHEERNNKNCPGLRLKVNSGISWLDYSFYVYKGIVKDREGKSQDLLLTVKNWKVTYVGVYTGKIDPYEVCKD
jgi:hypothetical protein